MIMKLRNKSSQPKPSTILLGLSEDEHHYCLVKKEADTFTTFWQKKPYDINQFIQKVTLIDTFNKTKLVRIIRPVPYEYIWRKTLFLPKSLNEIQLHQQVIHILKNEQPLAIEKLNIDYQQSLNTHNNLNKVTIHALHKNYAQSLSQVPCILDCELYCYIRAINYFKTNNSSEDNFCFSFKQKFIQCTEAEMKFTPTEPENCIHLKNILISEPNIDSDNTKHLYLLAFGASLWNGKELI